MTSETEHINTGGPAFGQVVELRCVRVDPCGAEEYEPALAQGGMTMRDYFAAKAVQGIYANPERKGTCVDAAERAYEVADAMIRAREAK